MAHDAVTIGLATRAAGLVLAATLCAGCGGGGGGGADPPPAAPHQNSAPVLKQPNGNQHGPALSLFGYDVSQNGTTFFDADHDLLTYTVSMTNAGGLFIANGTQISGFLPASGTIGVTVTVKDPFGASAVDAFEIRVEPNTAPRVAAPNGVVLVTPGAHVNYDPTQGGAAFVDDEGDRLAYTLTLISPPLGLSISGGRIVGQLDQVGAVTFEIVAADRYGGKSTDRFVIAVAAPDPGKPTLPATPFAYADERLALPFAFRQSSESPPGFMWDSQGGNRTTDAGAALGRVLFYDKRLSVTNTHSCSSCHHQANGFGSPARFDVGVIGVPQKRHTMSLTNARYNQARAWFSDMRVGSIEELVLMPIQEPTELGNVLSALEQKLAATDYYPPLFEAAFGTPDVTSDRISKALAQFVRALISYRSKFDLAYSNGTDETVLTPEEVRGSRLFSMADTVHLQCAECHQGLVQTMQYAENNGLDAVVTDPGTAFGFGEFRAPSLRNLAVSAPYMHDGRFATLREVIDHYDHGIQDNPDLPSELRMLNPDGSVGPRRLNLSEDDKAALEAFLRTLTDDALLTDPSFADPFQ